MTRDELVNSANRLVKPSPEVQSCYERNIDRLAESVTNYLSARDDIEQLVGEHGVDMMIDNHRNHARFMAHLFKEYSGEVFVNTVLWVLKTYKAHGFQDIYWSAQIDCWLSVLKAMLDDADYQEIEPFYNWLVVHMAALQTYEEQVLEQA